MRNSYRPMLRLALFGTYTLLAVGLHEVKSRLTAAHARIPAELKRPRPRRAASTSKRG
jgi:hypothetical protein